MCLKKLVQQALSVSTTELTKHIKQIRLICMTLVRKTCFYVLQLVAGQKDENTRPIVKNFRLQLRISD